MVKTVKREDLERAVINWQDAVGAELNGALEAFLGLTLGDVYGHHRILISMTDEGAARVEKLLRENHQTMIKVWLARNK